MGHNAHEEGTTTGTSNSALKDLEVLIGHWDMELSNAEFLPDPSTKVRGHANFEWIEDGDYLVMRQGDKTAGPPYSTSIIGRDEAEETYHMLYVDDRGVSRIYKMSLAGNEWRQWRESAGFSQRFRGSISADGNTISASWEKSYDGETWEHDFDVLYVRAQRRSR